MALTTDMVLVFGVMALAVVLFLTDRIRVDLVAILVMLLLPILGLVDGAGAFQGLASNAVVSIIAVIIMGRGLDHTGVISRVVRPLVALTGNNRTRIIALLSVTVAFISSVMQNIGAAALFLPAIRRISRQSRIAPARLLMPVGFAAILGGTITLVGSSPLIMLNDLLAPFGLPPLNLFSVTPIGVVLVVVGVGYFALFGNALLPQVADTPEACGLDQNGECPVQYYDKLGRLAEIRIPTQSRHKITVGELSDRYSVFTIAMAAEQGNKKLIPPPFNKIVEPGAVLAVYALEENLERAAAALDTPPATDLKVFATDLASEYAGLVEAVVPPHSKFIGRTLGEIHFRHNYLVAPLALYREDNVCYAHLSRETLHPGEGLLMHGRWEHFQRFRQKRNLIFSHAFDHEVLHPQKAGAALACFALATLLVFVTDLKLAVCLMVGALGMILTKVITIDEAYSGVDWRTVFLLAGLIPLGVATQKTGAAAWLAQHLLALVGQPPPVVLLFVIGLVATLFTLVVSNVGATVLLVPLVINLAQQMGTDPRLAALMVGLAASNSFLLPTHQVNALYMGPGRYRSVDFLKAGAPLSLIFLLVVTGMLWLFY